MQLFFWHALSLFILNHFGQCKLMIASACPILICLWYSSQRIRTGPFEVHGWHMHIPTNVPLRDKWPEYLSRIGYEMWKWLQLRFYCFIEILVFRVNASKMFWFWVRLKRCALRAQCTFQTRIGVWLIFLKSHLTCMLHWKYSNVDTILG